MNGTRRLLDPHASVSAADPQSHGGLLWLDLTRSAEDVSAVPGTAGRYCTTAIFDWDAAPCAIRAHLPDTLGIEFDHPEPADLAPIGDIARAFPGLPIVVVSAGHSEALVLRAMRMRAWDFLVKPLGSSELDDWIDAVLARAAAIRDARVSVECSAGIASDVSCGSGPRTAPAVAYVAERFRDHVTLPAAAELCHLSVSQFSRRFKREHGVTFSHFVAGMRIRHACDLLSHSPAQVKQVGFGVGFSDLAYFSRAFRRLVGVCPSEFRSTAHKP